MLSVRCTEPRKIISHYDPFLAIAPSDLRQQYCDTLDIGVFGDFSQYKFKPTIFSLQPLKSSYEDLAFCNPPDYWGIFATHVKDVKNFPKELDRSEGIIEFKHRDDFSPEIVQNISSICTALANRGNQQSFFTKPDSCVGFWQGVRVALKTKEMETTANTVDAEIKKLSLAEGE